MKVSKIKPNPNNPRIIKDERFAKLVQSIKDFPKMMELRPMVINSDNIVLGGNMRLKAITELGMKEIPDSWVKKATDLTEDEARRFIIADNIGFGEHDWEVLANEWNMDELTEWGLEMPDFVNKPEATEDDYEIPDEIKTDIVKGDLFELTANGITHRLLCGDSTNVDDVAKLMNGEKADMVFTDPPYDYKETKGAGIFKKQVLKVAKDIESISKFNPTDFLNSLPLYFEGKMSAFIFCNKDLVPHYLNFAIEAKYNFNILTWHKTTFIPLGGKHHYPDTEYCIFISKTPIFNAGLSAEHYYKYWVSGKDEINKKTHPTAKPIKIIALQVELCSNSKGIVCDPFGGSGSTLVAAAQLNRRCFIQELDEKYCQVIIDRFTKLYPETEIKRNGVLWTKTGELQAI